MAIDSRTALPQTIDDRQLERMVIEPARPLFPVVLEMAEALAPLIVVLAFLPTLYAVAGSTLSEQGALQGLASLRALSPVAADESFAGTEYDRLEALRFQPPLMTWLTALCLKVFGIGRPLGLSAAAYLCTAAMLLAAYALARRLGGERLGLVTVLLLAFNPLVLEGAQQPIPQSVAGLFALLSFTGIIAHWQKSSSIASYQLLLGGISLGLCLLAGGPVALAVVLIVTAHVVIWKLEARWRKTRGIIWDRSQFSRRVAFRSAVILAATAFALAGWQVLLYSSRFGTQFWSSWFALAVGGPREPAAHPGFALAMGLHRLVLPVFSLALVGLGAVVREVWRGEEDPARRHRLILFPWIAVAAIAWFSCGGLNAADAPAARAWATLLAIPLVIAAAQGLVEIAERRAGFVAALVACLAALADAAYFAGQPADHPAGCALLPAARLGGVFDNPYAIVAIALASGLVVYRIGRLNASRRRAALAVLVVAVVLTNCWWGISAIPWSDRHDHEIDDLRSGLAKLPSVERLAFVAPVRGGQSSDVQQPPARLVYSLATVWPGARFTFVKSWEAAEEIVSRSEAPAGGTTSAAFVVWTPRGVARGPVPDPSLKTAGPPVLFQGL
ncbi:MAG: glycosyltransferase family 39 protein [Planctomycetia bacterium]|nr:glycosyltransferase family 39 protein [Planctomycetia bacterium]